MQINIFRVEKNKFIDFLLYIGILFLMITSWLILKFHVIDKYISDVNLQAIREIYVEDENNISKRLKPLIDLNPDICGWIKINSTTIDYPVMLPKSDNPMFYLDHDHTKKSNPNGSVFINPVKEYTKKIQNLVLHAHNLKSGRMFGCILRYEDIEFYKSASIIIFDSIHGIEKFKVFSIFKTNTKGTQGKVFNYLRSDFKNDMMFLEFIYEIRKRSLIDTPVKTNAYDSLLMLSTCSYEMPDFRTVVVARKLRPFEDETIDFSKVKKAQSPLFPKAWYESKKMKVPETKDFISELKSGKIDWLG